MRPTLPRRSGQPTRWPAALFSAAVVVASVYSLAGPALAADAPATAVGPVVIRGRVVDDHGQAVEGATITAGAPAMGQVLWWAQTGGDRPVRSGPDGRFEVPVPFAGLLYQLNVERLGYDAPVASLIAAPRRRL